MESHLQNPFILESNSSNADSYKHEGTTFIAKALNSSRPTKVTENQLLHAIRCLGFKENNNLETSSVHYYERDDFMIPADSGPRIAQYLGKPDNTFHAELTEAVKLVEREISKSFKLELEQSKNNLVRS